MKLRIPSPSLVISTAALTLALGGGTYAAAAGFVSDQHIKQVVSHSTAGNSKKLGGNPANYYLPSKMEATSHGEHFLSAGQTVVLGKSGHFTFTAVCKKDSTNQNQVSFNVVANTTADLDGTGPSAAGNTVTIHTDSDALNTTTAAPLNPGDFTQVGSASSSTEIAQDGQEVDVFYNDGVNWPAMDGGSAHDCFAGYTGIMG